MKLSEAGAEALEAREGKRPKAYPDSRGIWTIGVGHTGPEVHRGLVWNQEQIHAAFMKDVEWAEDEVNKVAHGLNQNQFDALVSFVFNIGASAFRGSTVYKRLEADNLAGVPEAMMMWIKPAVLRKRRESEVDQFRSIRAG